VHGQKDLFTVLKCLSIIEPEIGYVQGMGYMVAILLLYVDKVDAFTIMHKIVANRPYIMKPFYQS
jgi:TBC1 domain-containing protein 4